MISDMQDIVVEIKQLVEGVFVKWYLEGGVDIESVQEVLKRIEELRQLIRAM